MKRWTTIAQRARAMVAVASVAVVASGCARVRDLPLDQLPRLTAEVRAGRPAVVTARDGRRARITSFSRLDVIREDCPYGACFETTLLVVDEPQRVLLYPDRLIVDAPPRRRRDPFEQTVLLAPPEKANPHDPRPVWGRVSKYSASRGLTIVGVAAGVALAVGAAAYLLVNAVTDDPHGLQPLLAANAAGGLAGGATLAFTFPATHELGTELEPSSKAGLGATKP